MEQAFYDLDAPVARVCSEEVPMPYAKHLEDAALPQPAKIVAAVRAADARQGIEGRPMIEFKLPSLGAEMDEGTLLEWKVKPGDAVHKGDVVAVVDTSKSAIDVEIWQEGTVYELLLDLHQKVPVGTVMARLLEPGETREHARSRSAQARRGSGSQGRSRRRSPMAPAPAVRRRRLPERRRAGASRPPRALRAQTLGVDLAHDRRAPVPEAR